MLIRCPVCRPTPEMLVGQAMVVWQIMVIIAAFILPGKKTHPVSYAIYVPSKKNHKYRKSGFFNSSA